MTEYEKLLEENKLLRRKLSPLEDPDFTKVLAIKLAPVDLKGNAKKVRGGQYVVVTPRQVARICGFQEDTRTLANIGRSLQAMLWERSYMSGELVFMMKLEEYKNGVQ